MMKYILPVLLFVMSTHAFAQITEIDPQEESESTAKDDDGDSDLKNVPFAKRLRFGGDFGAQFGTTTAVEVSPLVGYKVTKKLTAGLGFTYQYVKYEDPDQYNYYIDYKANVIGGRIFGEYDIFYGFFAHLEYEQLWVNVQELEAPMQNFSDVIPGLFIGGGYNFPLGRNSYFQLLALWNALWGSDNLVYGSAFIFRGGFAFGI